MGITATLPELSEWTLKTNEKDSLENLIHGQILSYLKVHLALFSTSHGL